MNERIALGGGCHWCTEAVFQALIGVEKVEQGFVAPLEELSTYSEAVIVYFDPSGISLSTLIEIHLHTHSSTSHHNLRSKYRSAVYAFDEASLTEAETILNDLQKDFPEPLVTRVYSFGKFQSSPEEFQNYYLKDPSKPFCQTYIAPKLKKILQEFSGNFRRH